MGRDAHEERKRKGTSRGLKRNRGVVADWQSVNAELLRNAISTAGLSGGALRLGYTSDGGAYSVGIYGDGDPYNEYCRPGEDVEQLLRDIIELFEDMGPRK